MAVAVLVALPGAGVLTGMPCCLTFMSVLVVVVLLLTAVEVLQ